MIDVILKYWIEFALGLVSGGLVIWSKHLATLLYKRKDENDAIRQGVMSLLHDRLMQSCDYYLDLGYIPVSRSEEIMDNIKVIYDAYHSLNGNGTGTAKYNKFLELPIRGNAELDQHRLQNYNMLKKD